MPAIFPQVNRDAIGARPFRCQGKRHRVWFHGAAMGLRGIAIARLAQRGTVININAEKNHGRRFDASKGSASLTGKSEMTQPKPPAKKENPLINLVCNIVVPTLVLMKFSSERWLGPLYGLIVALAFPIGYGIYDLARRKKTNFLSILGFVSVLLSGGLALIKVGGIWFAVKDALLPTLIGVAVLASLRTKKPLVRELFYNDQILDVARIDAALDARGERAHFDRLLRRASLGLALTFLASAPVNFALALYVLKSPPGTPEFNAELGRMHILVWPVIAIPSMAAMMIVFWRLLNGRSALTGLSQEEIFHAEKPKA